MDIETKIKLKLGFAQARSGQDYQILATVVNAALGGTTQKAKPPSNFDEAAAQFSALFGKK